MTPPPLSFKCESKLGATRVHILFVASTNMPRSPTPFEDKFGRRLKELDRAFAELMEYSDPEYGPDPDGKERELKKMVEAIHAAIRTAEHEMADTQKWFGAPVTIRPHRTATHFDSMVNRLASEKLSQKP